MNKKENKEWMERAESVLQSTEWNCPLFKGEGKTIIYDSYNGQVAALGVSILMIGLKPTLAIYYQDAPKRALLEVIVRMLRRKEDNKEVYGSAESLVRHILEKDKKLLEEKKKKLKMDILNCSIALKQVIRTYKLEKDGENNK